jgi:trehalose 6-phosphate phosphatase
MTTMTFPNISECMKKAGLLWLFLDYDGTLADFAPTPDDVYPDQQVIDLITQLSHQPFVKIAIISGRRLKHIQKLLPVDGIWLAGTYGIELQSPEGELIQRISYEQTRPILEMVKPTWEAIIENRPGFYLEDKGWSLAIHAKDALPEQATAILTNCREQAATMIVEKPFRVLGGDRFLEIAPQKANKGDTVEYLLSKNHQTDSCYVYIGDDDKDEYAFGIIKKYGGLAILVADQPRQTYANMRLPDPQSVRQWLWDLIKFLEVND